MSEIKLLRSYTLEQDVQYSIKITTEWYENYVSFYEQEYGIKPDYSDVYEAALTAGVREHEEWRTTNEGYAWQTEREED